MKGTVLQDGVRTLLDNACGCCQESMGHAAEHACLDKMSRPWDGVAWGFACDCHQASSEYAQATEHTCRWCQRKGGGNKVNWLSESLCDAVLCMSRWLLSTCACACCHAAWCMM
jgi:hypothetical protein